MREQRELESRNFTRRARACQVLAEEARSGDSEVIGALLERLADSHPHVRSAAAGSLSEAPSSMVVPALLERLSKPSGDDRPGHRASLVLALGLTDTPCEGEVLETLSNALGDADPDVRFQALATLTDLECTDPAFVEAVERLLGDGDDEVVAVAAGAAADLALESSLPLILSRWEKASGFAKRHLALAAAHFGADQVVPTLVDAARAGRDSIEAIDALVVLGTEKSKGGLLELVSSWRAHPLVRARASVALAEVGHELADEWIRKHLASRKEELRTGTIEWLGRLRVGPYLPRLLDLLADPKGRDSAHAAYSLGLSEEREFLEPLRKAAESDPREEVREQAALAVEHLVESGSNR